MQIIYDDISTVKNEVMNWVDKLFTELHDRVKVCRL